MSVSARVCIFVLFAAALIAPAAYGLTTAATPAHLEPGKKLYRKYCGQCHALKEARAVGIGIGITNKSGKGETDLAGPSFNELRVPAQYSMLAIQGVWDGHAKVITLLTHDDIRMVSKWIESATRDHRYKAYMPSDAFR